MRCVAPFSNFKIIPKSTAPTLPPAFKGCEDLVVAFFCPHFVICGILFNETHIFRAVYCTAGVQRYSWEYPPITGTELGVQCCSRTGKLGHVHDAVDTTILVQKVSDFFVVRAPFGRGLKLGAGLSLISISLTRLVRTSCESLLESSHSGEKGGTLRSLSRIGRPRSYDFPRYVGTSQAGCADPHLALWPSADPPLGAIVDANNPRAGACHSRSHVVSMVCVTLVSGQKEQKMQSPLISSRRCLLRR